ncbi:MAG: rhodanese-like domain-containing protein [Streptococcaceae bacterium]|nr:rhodanese-like domain-containing protein [Streptococcaceae bacterium]
MKSITTTELTTALEKGATLLDIREAFEYQSGHVPVAKNLPMSELESRLSEIQPGSYLICQSGARSERACNYLAAQGIEVTNVLGGTSAWAGELM